MEMLTAQRVGRRFSRALRTYDCEAHVQQEVCSRMASWLVPYIRETGITRALEIGCGTGSFTSYLQALFPNAEWTLNDLSEACTREASLRYCKSASVLVGDAETVLWTGRYQLIASASTVQWFSNPGLWVKKMSRLQCEGDLLCFTTYMPGTLCETRQITGKGLEYPSMEQWHEWLSAFYDTIFARSETLCLRFDSPLAVLRHLKDTGVTGTGGEFWTRSRLHSFEEKYRAAYEGKDGKVKLTYVPAYFLMKRNAS